MLVLVAVVPGRVGLEEVVADVQRRLVLAAPEYLESPLREGGWAAATADGWHAKARS